MKLSPIINGYLNNLIKNRAIHEPTTFISAHGLNINHGLASWSVCNSFDFTMTSNLVDILLVLRKFNNPLLYIALFYESTSNKYVLIKYSGAFSIIYYYIYEALSSNHAFTNCLNQFNIIGSGLSCDATCLIHKAASILCEQLAKWINKEFGSESQ